MLVPSPHTWQPGDKLAADQDVPPFIPLNREVRDTFGFLMAQPYSLAFLNANQTLTTSVWAAIGMANEEYDNDVMHDTVTNNTRVIAKTAGLYLMCAAVAHLAVNTTGVRRMQVRKNAGGVQTNGTLIMGTPTDNAPSASTSAELNGTKFVPMAANDYLELFAFQSSGGNASVVAGLDNTFLHLVRMYSLP